MSFAYMFKFIIIGDTGISINTKVSGNLACSYSSSIGASDRSIKSPSESNSEPK